MQYMLTYSKHGQTEAYLEPCQAPKMKLFVKIVHNFQSLTIFAKARHWKFFHDLNFCGCASILQYIPLKMGSKANKIMK